MKQRTILLLFVLTGFLTACGFDIFNQPLRTYAVALADFDEDGDLDAFFANGKSESVYPDTVWWNDGSGNFSDSGMQLEPFDTHEAVVSDFDSDGDIDVLVDLGGSMWLIQNNRSGQLQFLPRHSGQFYIKDFYGSHDLAVGDLDSDGDMDAFQAGCCGSVAFGNNWTEWYPPTSLVWYNNGAGRFDDSGQRLGDMGSSAVALGDLDGDGDLDAFLGNSSSVRDVNGNSRTNEPNTVWFNDGSGRFSDSGQLLGSSETTAVALGDLDGDGDLDAFTGNREVDEIWFNDGLGNFTNSRQSLGNSITRYTALSDFDGDGDLDLLVDSEKAGLIWWNDGSGIFTDGQPEFSHPQECALGFGDVDGDSDLDVIAGSPDDLILVWRNDGAGNFTLNR